ncbi:MAG: thioesterase family protein [Dehalococcoidia bacterium]|nr:thioesterase family protein [Dehalococcoidia bacterium]
MSGLSEQDEKLSKEMGLQGRYPPFVELLGVQFEPSGDDRILIRLPMRTELALAPDGLRLHGGVITSVMDIVGGATVAWKLRKDVEGLPLAEQARRLTGVNTIDLRIDFLQPGRGKVFTGTGTVLRTGKKIAVARMELHNDEQELVAVGTGTFRIG